MSKSSNNSHVGPIEAIMSGIVDYAGLFPPARLPLKEALANYVTYTTGTFSWMLGRFVCPYSSLDELQNLLRENPPAETIQVSLIAPVPLSDNTGLFRHEFSTLLDHLVEYNTTARNASTRRAPHLDASSRSVASSESRSMFVVDAIETRWIDGSSSEGSESIIQQSIDPKSISSILDQIASHPLTLQALYIETPSDVDFPLEAFGKSVFEYSKDLGFTVGLKLRSGGITPEAFPSTESIAQFIATCSDIGIPFKATAGLHHPIRHFNVEVGAKMHGFINVFFAAAARRVLNINATLLNDILSEEDAEAFSISDQFIRWRNVELTTPELIAARSLFANSFGSCSFDEPIEDLRSLNLLPNNE